MLREGQTERFSFQDITDSQASVTQNIAGLPVNYSQPLVKYVKEFFHKQKDHHSKFYFTICQRKNIQLHRFLALILLKQAVGRTKDP